MLPGAGHRVGVLALESCSREVLRGSLVVASDLAYAQRLNGSHHDDTSHENASRACISNASGGGPFFSVA